MDDGVRVAVFDGFEQLAAATGREVAVGSWLTLDQACIDGFAAATGDRDQAMAMLPGLTGTCVACHAAYRVR